MFIDKVEVKLRAGQGGNGIVSFRHEKFIARGGPDGGDGGNGGDIIVRGSNNQNTLANYRYKKELFSENGGNGGKRKKHGKNGKDLIIDLPVGTIITDESGNILADIESDGEEIIVASGGNGGFGNAHFVSSRRQAPRVAEKGEPGDEILATLELKIIADVGLVGLPNAGKSTFLSRVSNAKPEIADYPFTTLVPNLGVVDIDKSSSVLIADIPGLIEGASQGKGLGDDFLKHIERTKILIHLIDAYSDNIAKDYQTIEKELAEYQVDLSKRPRIIALNKVDGLDKEIVNDQIKQLKPYTKGKKIFAISAVSGEGIEKLLYELKKVKKESKTTKPKKDDSLPVITLTPKASDWNVTKTAKGYNVSGKKIERFALRTNFDSDEGIDRLLDIMYKLGITKELEKQKIQPGDKIIFGQSGQKITYGE